MVMNVLLARSGVLSHDIYSTIIRCIYHSGVVGYIPLGRYEFVSPYICHIPEAPGAMTSLNLIPLSKS